MAAKHKKAINQALYGQDQPSSDPSEHTFSGGHHILRREFYYSHGLNSGHHAEKTSKALNAAGIKHTVVDHGTEHKPFKGGGGAKDNSHHWVKIKVHDEDNTQHEEKLEEDIKPSLSGLQFSEYEVQPVSPERAKEILNQPH